MKIGDLAVRTKISVRALRYYEDQGLLSASRTPAGQEQRELLTTELGRINDQIDALSKTRDQLATLIATVPAARR